MKSAALAVKWRSSSEDSNESSPLSLLCPADCHARRHRPEHRVSTGPKLGCSGRRGPQTESHFGKTSVGGRRQEIVSPALCRMSQRRWLRPQASCRFATTCRAKPNGWRAFLEDYEWEPPAQHAFLQQSSRNAEVANCPVLANAQTWPTFPGLAGSNRITCFAHICRRSADEITVERLERRYDNFHSG